MVYIDGKPVLLVCDNTVYVKMLDDVTKKLKNTDVGYPYDEAKQQYILDIENSELVKKVIEILIPITPIPKSRKNK